MVELELALPLAMFSKELSSDMTLLEPLAVRVDEEVSDVRELRKEDKA